jgi:hypothetical protein
LLTSAPPLLGSTKPRIYTPPLTVGLPGPCGCGCALTPKTSLGFSLVDFSETVLGITLLPWQRFLAIHALELRVDGRFRFRTILILVARQNGKTTVIEVKNLWKMFVLQVKLVIGTAQNLDVSEESWDKAVEIVESIPELEAEKAHVDKTNGKKALRLANGSRWKIAAASRKGGRGLSGDDVNLDELREHLDWLSWGAVTKTTMARPNAQIFAFSNAGDDRSVVLNTLRATAKALVANPATDPTMGLFEWSAPEDVKCTCGRIWTEDDPQPHRPDCRLWDRQAWAAANPSLGYTITEEAIASAMTTDPEAVFRTEVLCQRVPTMASAPIPQPAWLELADVKSQANDPVALSLEVNNGRAAAAIGCAGLRDDRLKHLEVIKSAEGVAWTIADLVTLNERLKPCAIVIDDKSEAAALIPDLKEAGLTVTKEPKRGTGEIIVLTNADDMADASGSIYTSVTETKDVRHLNQLDLTNSLAGAAWRPLGDKRAWSRKHSRSNPAPWISVTLALHGLLTYGPKPAEQPFFMGFA